MDRLQVRNVPAWTREVVHPRLGLCLVRLRLTGGVLDVMDLQGRLHILYPWDEVVCNPDGGFRANPCFSH